jgi:hypothetical protein
MSMSHLITFSTYGARVHGDARGSFMRDGGFVPKNGALESFQRAIMKADPFALDPRARSVVVATTREVCAHNAWVLTAVHARTEHVHAVVAVDVPIERAIATIKAWSTRRLRESRLVDPSRPVWAAGGNHTRLTDSDAIYAAREYVIHRQGEMMAWWDALAGSLQTGR